MPSAYDLGHDDGTIAERERIVALIREKADEWETENQRVMDYGGTPVLDGEVSAAREFITLIEATDA